MIIVKHEKIVEETFGLIELNFYLRGCQVYLRVNPHISTERVDHIQNRANNAMERIFAKGWTCS